MKINLKKVRKSTPAVITQGEVQAIEQTLEFAERYGYGNLMAWLATGWAKKLHQRSEPRQVTPYPTNWLDAK